MKAFNAIVVAYLTVLLLSVAGWITNVVYAFNHFSSALTVEVIVSFIGILAAPLGTLHGIYLWFC
jgi:hypothetical protein